MAGSATMIEPQDMPSFSRLGRSTTNAKELEEMESLKLRSQRRAKRMPAVFRSITESDPLLHGFNVDRGRTEAMTSSPRRRDLAEEGADELQFRRVGRWAGSSGTEGTVRPPPGPGAAGKPLTARGEREHPMVPKKVFNSPS